MSDTGTQNQPSTPAPSPGSAQANIVKVARYANQERRDWSLYLFFRIMKQSEVTALESIASLLRAELENLAGLKGRGNRKALENIEKITGAGEVTKASLQALVTDGQQARGSKLETEKQAAMKPAKEFFIWLATVSGTAPQSGKTSVATKKAGSAGLDETKGWLKSKSKPEKILADIGKLIHSKTSLPKKIFGIERLLVQLLGVLMKDMEEFHTLHTVLEMLGSADENESLSDDERKMVRLVTLAVFILFTQRLRSLLRDQGFLQQLVGALGKDAETAGHNALKGGLPLAILYEFARQILRKDIKAGEPGALRSEASERNDTSSAQKGKQSAKPYPINTAFTYRGLEALQLIDKKTLESFPAAFREGMAARAEYLGDTGPNAPANWEGELGSEHIHGYLNTSFEAGGASNPLSEANWKALRAQVRSFNNRQGRMGLLLRQFFGSLLPILGIELLHVELGQDPYRLEKPDTTGQEKRITLKHRLEHFGFRDGISQPVVDMGLDAADPGGGTPDRNRTWQAVAPGEIFLGQPDEEGVRHLEPFNATLRDNGTFMVFRKLEQDVVGFRRFLKQQRSNKQEQEKLAAQMMGRWKSGVSLIDSPDSDADPDSVKDTGINDFLYAKDDPEGLKCPLGSHVRRTNPRDTGNGKDVRRHRILRRSIAYGGPLLPEDSLGDGEPRGLLFVAANSRIEQQFEVIQAMWVNGSEFLGQAGLGKCPITGTNKATVFDAFHEAKSAVPVVNIPTFVLLKGGDYFFVPSVNAIQEMARSGLSGDGDIFQPDESAGYTNYHVGLGRTPILFEEERIRNYIVRLADRLQSVIPVGQQQMADVVFFPHNHRPEDPEPLTTDNVVFVGQHTDVSQVLGGNPTPENLAAFSVPHYRAVSKRVLHGGLIPVATDGAGDTADDRQRLHGILATAWQKAARDYNLNQRMNETADRRLNKAIRSALQVGKIDLVHDLATRSVYDVIRNCYGIGGPPWLTELAHSLPFTRKHVGEIHPDWLAALSGREVSNPSQTTLHIWSILFFADLITNVKSQQELHDLGLQAGREFLSHIEGLLKLARQRGPSDTPTLLDAFVAVCTECMAAHNIADEASYFRDVAAILLELTAATMLNIPAIFGKVMDFTLTNRIDLSTLVPILDMRSALAGMPDDGLNRLIYESDRLNTAFGLFLRYCKEEVTLSGSGHTLKEGQWALALVNAANLDSSAFPNRLAFSLAPHLPGPERKIENYLLFGPNPKRGGRSKNIGKLSPEDRICRGRDYIALNLLRRLLRHTQQFKGLHRIPGTQGEVQDLLRVPIGLNVRFSRQ